MDITTDVGNSFFGFPVFNQSAFPQLHFLMILYSIRCQQSRKIKKDSKRRKVLFRVITLCRMPVLRMVINGSDQGVPSCNRKRTQVWKKELPDLRPSFSVTQLKPIQFHHHEAACAAWVSEDLQEE